MIGENIKKYRKAKGINQEELAVKLHVVRQTVSKWENGLSVPDADILMDLAKELDVSVTQLLGTNETVADNLAEELARLNAQIAENIKRERLLMQAERKRNLILFLSFSAMLAMLIIQNQLVSILLTAACVFAAIMVLYRNLALLTSSTSQNTKTSALKITTIFNAFVLVICVAIILMIDFEVINLSEKNEKIFASMIVSAIIIFAGIISPKLPFNRHTGLRLPWTVQDEETWNTAHKIIGYISLPIAFLYIAAVLTLPYFETATAIAMIIWLGTPTLLSYIYFFKKMRGRL